MEEEIEISVFNSLGSRVGYTKARVPEEINFSLKDFPPGLYLIRFKTTKDESVIKVIHN